MTAIREAGKIATHGRELQYWRTVPSIVSKEGSRRCVAEAEERRPASGENRAGERQRRLDR